MRRGAGALVAGTLAAACLASPALGAEARVQGGGFLPSVSFLDPDAEPNDVTVRVGKGAAAVLFTEAAAEIHPGRRCEPVAHPDTRVRCRTKRDRFFILDLIVAPGGGSDTVTTHYRDHFTGSGFNFAVVLMGAGADVFDGGPANDFVLPGLGDDQVDGGRGADTLISRGIPDGADVFDGGRAGALVAYQGRREPVEADLDGLADDGAAGENDQLIDIDGLFGGRAGDLLVGNAQDNFIAGGPGRDRIETGAGQDILFGMRGGDTLVAGEGDDLVLASGDDAGNTADCGPGQDVAFVDRRDITTGCERERRGVPFRKAERIAATKGPARVQTYLRQLEAYSDAVRRLDAVR
jgi:Ca2+-binding RTX toxin-like protein